MHNAALAHLSRYAATEAGLVRVLDRVIARWAWLASQEGLETEAATADARRVAREIACALVAAGAVDDAAFAASRARSLARSGRSRRAISAHLAAKGVARDVADAALPADEAELVAALAYARRRRLGPFRSGEADADALRREIGALARAGFPQPVVRRALRMALDEAEALVIEQRQE